jgi:hypothetical protein
LAALRITSIRAGFDRITAQWSQGSTGDETMCGRIGADSSSSPTPPPSLPSLPSFVMFTKATAAYWHASDRVLILGLPQIETGTTDISIWGDIPALIFFMNALSFTTSSHPFAAFRETTDINNGHIDKTVV